MRVRAFSELMSSDACHTPIRVNAARTMENKSSMAHMTTSRVVRLISSKLFAFFFRKQINFQESISRGLRLAPASTDDEVVEDARIVPPQCPWQRRKVYQATL